MIKKTLYPKTKRYNDSDSVTITEKLDGSNLTIFKVDNELHIGQRNYIFKADEIDGSFAYKGLSEWLETHGEELRSSLHPNSAIVGEWIKMGKLKYDDIEEGFHMFAKANVNEEFEMRNLYYDRDLFKYCFIGQEIPDFINSVPVVVKLKNTPALEALNKIYEDYTELVNRNVEGFIVISQGVIKKYVRMKSGKLEDHHS